MQLKVLLPSGVFFDKNDVERIVAETRDGSFGILPHRRDCVAALAPGILTYQTGNSRSISP
jgi:F-type H+-transporting ATPase subunit epsilon